MAIQVDFDDSAVQEQFDTLCAEIPNFAGSYDNIIVETFVRRCSIIGTWIAPNVKRVPIYSLPNDPINDSRAQFRPAAIAVISILRREEGNLRTNIVRVLQLWHYGEWNQEQAIRLLAE